MSAVYPRQTPSTVYGAAGAAGWGNPAGGPTGGRLRWRAVPTDRADRADRADGDRRISRDDVLHVARLARLDLTSEEVHRFTTQLGDVLARAAEIASLDTAGVPPTAHPLPVVNVLRDDVVGPSLERNEVLAAAPDALDGRFRVPRILG